MPAQAQHTVFTAFLSSTTDTVARGKILVLNSAGAYYVVATTAARAAAAHKCAGVAITAGDSTNPAVELQAFGEIPASISGLAAGSASWVRVSSTGTFERCTPSGSDEIVGYCDADGTVHAAFGVLSASSLAASTPPTGTGFARVTSGAYDAASSAVNLAGGATHITGTLPVGNGGTGITALGTGVATFLGTPSSANLASAVTDETGSGALVFGTAPTLKSPSLADSADATKIVTLDMSGITTATTRAWVFPDAAGTFVAAAATQTLTNKTINGASNTLTVRLGSDVSGTLPVANGGTGVTSLTVPASGILVGTTDTQTLTNKILTTPTIAQIVNTGTLTLPSSNDTLVGRATTDTLTNKTLTSPVLGGTPQYTGTRGVIKSVVAEVQTTDATVTTCGSYTMSDETLCAFDVIVTAARRTNVTKGGRWKRSVVYRRTSAGAPTIVGTLETGTDQETDSAWDVTIDVSSNDVRVRVTGAAATNVNWITEMRVQELPAT